MPPWAKSSPVPDLVNNVLMEYSNPHLSACCLWLFVYWVVKLRGSGRDHMAHKAWSIYREGLLISELNSPIIFWLTLVIKLQMAGTAQERFIVVSLHQDLWSNDKEYQDGINKPIGNRGNLQSLNWILNIFPIYIASGFRPYDVRLVQDFASQTVFQGTLGYSCSPCSTQSHRLHTVWHCMS